MNDVHRIVSQLAWIFAAASVVACQQTDSTSDVADESSNPVVPDTDVPMAEVQELISTVVESPGKPLPPIDFKYELLGEPVIGQPLEIRVTSSFQAELDALNVALSGSERMQVPAAVARFRMARSAASAPATRTISVTPLAAGTTYLNVLLQADIGGRTQSRAVTIPIRVGAASPRNVSNGVLSTDADGQPIISLPADEN